MRPVPTFFRPEESLPGPMSRQGAWAGYLLTIDASQGPRTVRRGLRFTVR